LLWTADGSQYAMARRRQPFGQPHSCEGRSTGKKNPHCSNVLNWRGNATLLSQFYRRVYRANSALRLLAGCDSQCRTCASLRPSYKNALISMKGPMRYVTRLLQNLLQLSDWTCRIPMELVRLTFCACRVGPEVCQTNGIPAHLVKNHATSMQWGRLYRLSPKSLLGVSFWH